MLLQYKSDHLSIEKFDAVNLSDFSILTGVNGSGKTQLMTAIIQEHAQIDSIKSSNIIYFDFTQFRIENESNFNTQQLIQERNNAWLFFTASQIQGIGIFKDKLKSIKNNNFSSEECEIIKKISEENNISLLKLEEDDFIETDLLKQKFQNYRLQFENDFQHQNIKNQQFTQAIKALSKKLPIFLDEVSEEVFRENYIPTTLKGDFLPTQLGKIFLDYRIKEYEEFMKVVEDTDEPQKRSDARQKASEKCKKMFGGYTPWELINEFLNNFQNFGYEISFPEEFDRNKYFRQSEVNFSPRLKNNMKELSIDFQSLSSGEQVLFSLALCLFKSKSDNLFPKLLLLDEIDATLHPSMIDNLLHVIHDVLLKKGTKVVLATHSPTTIALAPEESIFVVNKEGKNRIEHRDKKSALEILTQGYVTLDGGLRIFDQISKHEISVITEGDNTKYIAKAIELFANDKKDKIDIITGVEGSSGKEQLKTLFDFFTKVKHDKKVIFVWDCDFHKSVSKDNNTFPFILEKNNLNNLAKNGIENLFDEHLFENFIESKTDSKGIEEKRFDTRRKVDFMNHMLSISDSESFKNFKPLIDSINSILES